jgi:hypothetical protein
MDDAEKIFFPKALSGEVDALGSLRETSLSGPGINDAAEYVSADSLAWNQFKQQYHYGRVARSSLILWYWYFGGHAGPFSAWSTYTPNLSMWRSRGGQVHVKSRAALRLSDRPQAPTMRLNDRPADTKPHACAVRFSCEERVKNLFCAFWRKPWAGITHGHENLLVFNSLRLDDHLSYSINVPHRFDAVDD